MKSFAIAAFSLALAGLAGCSAAPSVSDNGDETATVEDSLKSCSRTNTACARGFRCEIEEGKRNGKCVADQVMCPMIWNPVCGEDGKTYSNVCVAGAAGAKVAYSGECETPAPDACASRTNGAFVTFQMEGDAGSGVSTETFTVWSTNAEFIDESIRLKSAGEQRVPVFAKVLVGTECNAGWSWHVDPADMSYADMTIELCDGRPSYLESNLSTWIAQVGQYCPWSVKVTAIDDRR